RMTRDGVRGFVGPAVATAIPAGPDGNLWFTSPIPYASRGGPVPSKSIGRITPDGVVSVFNDPNISGPSGITAGPDGNLWFFNLFGNSIGRITPAGVVSSFNHTHIDYFS